MNIENLQAELLKQKSELATNNTINVTDNYATAEEFQLLAEKAKAVESLAITNDQLTELPDLTGFEKVVSITLYCPKLTVINARELPQELKSFRINIDNSTSISDDFWQQTNSRRVTITGPGLTTLRLPAEIKTKRLKLATTNLVSIQIDGPQTNLELLDITGRMLKHLNSDFENLKSIQRMELNAPIETADFKFDSDVKLLSLRIHSGMPADASFLKTLSEVSSLHVYGSEKEWSGLPDLNHWEDLTDLYLRNCQDSELSQQVLAGKNLSRISLQDSQLHFRPEMFRESNHLDFVLLNNVPPVSITDCVKHLPEIDRWIFQKIELIDVDQLSAAHCSIATSLALTEMKNELTNFDFLDAFPNLKYLEIEGKQPILYSAFLREKTVPLEQIISFIPEFKYNNAKQFCSLASAICKSGLPREDQEYLVNLIANQKTLQIPKSWDWSFLLKATNVSNSALKKRLWSVLEEKSEQILIENPLNKNSVLYLSGKSKLKVAELKTFCETLGIQLVKKYNDQVSHVLIGAKSPDYDLLKNKKFIPVTDTHLAKAHTLSQPQFLKYQEMTEDGSVPSALENLDQLLSTDDGPTLLMALEMVKQGGLPEKSIGTLMVKHKTTQDAKVRKKSKELLELYADATWRPLLSDRGSFKSINKPNKREVDTRRQLKDLAKRTSPTLAGNFSCLLFEKVGKGLRYALTAGLKKELKKKAYQLLLTDQSFNFSRGLGFSERGDKHNLYQDNYIMPEQSVALPILALELDAIHTLDLTNCRYGSELPDKIGQFKDLQHLILAINELASLPEVFAQLVELESIDLRDNLFTSFPKILGTLPKLIKVDLRANKGVEVPDAFVRSHPDCTVLLGE